MRGKSVTRRKRIEAQKIKKNKGKSEIESESEKEENNIEEKNRIKLRAADTLYDNIGKEEMNRTGL